MNDPKNEELFKRLVRKLGMGEIQVSVLLENEHDLYAHEVGTLSQAEIRRVRIDAVVDTGAVLILLPQDIVEALGLRKTYRAIVTLADDRKIELDRAGGLFLTVCGRKMTADCLVGPPGCEPLLGQIVLESLDLIPDPLKRTITPRPESPFLPTLKMKRVLDGRAPVGA